MYPASDGMIPPQVIVSLKEMHITNEISILNLLETRSNNVTFS